MDLVDAKKVVRKSLLEMSSGHEFLRALRSLFCQCNVPSESIDAAYYKGRADVVLVLQDLLEDSITECPRI